MRTGHKLWRFEFLAIFNKIRSEQRNLERRSAGDRQDSQPLGAADPRPAACPGAAIRSVPNNLRPKTQPQKPACQRKPPELLALSSSEQLHKHPFAPLPAALRPSRPVQRWDFSQAEKELTTLPVLRYGSGHRKCRLKILSITCAREGAFTFISNHFSYF